MAENVIRQDVIQLDFDINFGDLTKLTKELDEIKKSFKGGIGDDELDDLKENLEDAQKETKTLKEKFKDLNQTSLDKIKGGLSDAGTKLKDLAKTSLDKLKTGISNVGTKLKNLAQTSMTKLKNSLSTIKTKLTEIAQKAAGAALTGLKKLAGVSFKALAVGLAGAATAVGTLVTKAVQAYSEFEQLEGGMKKIFDKADQSKITKDANNAYYELGLTANEYLATINDVGAMFSATMGDQKGYDVARTGMLAISDYASGTGKSVDVLSEKFAMITRSSASYQSIADQFAGILPATSADFLKQAQAAGLVSKKYTELTKVPIDEYQNAVAKMLEKGVKDLGLTGNTAAEATKTISGSLGMMRSAWGNLLVAMASGENLDQCIDNMVKAVEAFGTNVLPVAEKALYGIGTVIEKLAPIIADKLPELSEKLLPPLVKATVSLVNGLIKALPTIIKVLIAEIPDAVKSLMQNIVDTFGEQFPTLKKINDYFKDNADSIKGFFGKAGSAIAKFTPILIGLIGAFKLLKGAAAITSLFGGKSKGGESGGGGLFNGLINTFKGLAKTSPKTVLLGLANLAIIIGGFTILTAAVMAVAPLIAKLSDGKSIIKLIAIMGVLGLLGTALAKLAGIVGAIPVATVALGLANMAIVLVGFGALAAVFAWVAPYIAQMSDLKSILKVAAIMGILGVLGTALTVFAGICGAIPIPVVLLGLANMALVLAGVSAIILAFGALSKIDGFADFIEFGGKLLAKIFNVLGEIVGSLIGGIGEGITNSLPTIGENLSAFAKSLQPMFSVFSGADMSGISAFFKAFGGFMLQMAGNDILSFFTGGTDFAKLGTELTTFADNSAGFFNKVATLKQAGFDNATKLFECLAGVKSLPKEGGVVGWFKGNISYESLANGLKQLSSEKVIGFFNAVTGLKQAGFDNAKKLFDCLAGLKSLPKDGGVVGWFSGEVDYSKLATGLGQLSKESVKSFFTMVGGIKEKAFDNAKKFFECLADISDLPKEGGWWDKITGSETTTLSNIAKELGSFGDETAVFFDQINSLKLSNLNGLWDSLKKSENVTANVSKIVDENIDNIVKKIKELPKKMGEGLESGSKSLADSFVTIWTDAVKASVKPVNKLLEGANWLLKEFGSKKKAISWTPYAHGTDGHKGGNALVNDGRGAELIQMPNGNAFIPNGRNVFIPNAPKGMKVLPAENTAKLMGKNAPTFHYANGVGDIDIWSFIDKPKDLVGKISDTVSYDGMSGFPLNLGRSMVSTVSGEMTAWVEKLFEEEGALSLASYVASKGVEQWRSTVIRALKMEGQYSAANVTRTLYQMKTESGGNPKAINLWDSNAKKGIPSKGLMQVIDPTFRAYARKGFNKNIYDPLSNILASVRYATSRYGSLAKAYRGVGYANGGLATSPSIFAEDGAEMAIPLSRDKKQRAVGLWQQTGDMLGITPYSPDGDGATYNSHITEHNTYSPSFTVHIEGTNDDRAMARKVKQWISEALEETFDSLERKTTRLQEV